MDQHTPTSYEQLGRRVQQQLEAATYPAAVPGDPDPAAR
ncbi:hypothetical protein BEI_1022 [Halomonas beimenensis]|uniref:Uncharacterized protein n=1 Tax=Halomonas beimenensis TaxID=475662 RepID=A0A291P568_9GAMM|nr:hypothetical protein BEI_1022 [Halomonas beimenensis]